MANEIVTVPVQLNVPKETKEIIDFMAAIIEDAINKKSISEIATGNLAGLMSSIDGAMNVPAEIKSQHKAELTAYAVEIILSKLGL